MRSDVLRVAWRSLRAHKSRLALSTIAVILGVSFVGGSFIFSDTLKATFTELFGQTTSDVVVTPVKVVDSSTNDASVTLPASLVPTIAAVDGVSEAVGGVFVQGVLVVGRDGKPVGSGQAPAFGLDWSGSDLSPLTLTEGAGPSRAGEIGIDSETASKGKFVVGDVVSVVLPKGSPVKEKIVGIFRYGSTGNLAGASLTAFDPLTAQRLLLAPGRISQIDVKADAGVSQDALAVKIRAVTPPTAKVQTGKQSADQAAADINSGFAFFDYLILAFAGISLLVGVFLIVNTFSMLVATRARELALLRALGASRRQVSSSLLVEATVVGLVGSTLGFALGLLLALGLKSLLGAFGADLPSNGLVVLPRTVIVCYLVGMLVTLVSAWFPARRAARVPPVAAMRDSVTIPTRSLRIRVSIGSVVTVLGALALLGGVSSSSTASGASLVALGALLALVGVAVIAPVLARPMVAVFGWPIRRISKLTGRIAVDNAGRNRSRTAGTASALMIGLAVVSTFAVIGASINASVDETIDNSIGADFLVQPTGFTGAGFSPDVATSVAKVAGVSSVAAVQDVPAKIDGKGGSITAIDPLTAGKAVKVKFKAGSWESLDASTIGLDADAVKRDGAQVGDVYDVVFANGSKAKLTLDVVYKATGLTGYVTSNAVPTAAGIPRSDINLYISVDPAADPASVRPALEKTVAAYPNVKLQDRTELKASTHKSVNTLLSFIYALLALSILIAVLGIVNTLALSVIERTREIGLLRAVGMSRAQVKSMIRWESLIIACIGAVLGILLGVVFGSALQHVLSSQGLSSLAIPTTQLVAFVVVAGFVGVLAAWRPARRAAKLDVLDAIATE